MASKVIEVYNLTPLSGIPGSAPVLPCLHLKHVQIGKKNVKLNFSRRLSATAKFDGQDGITVLKLDGKPLSYAETPALPVHSTDLTIAVWIKLLGIQGNRQLIYGDWPASQSFGLGIDPNGRLCSGAWSATGNVPVFAFCRR